MTEAERREAARAKAMLRRLKFGDRVVATKGAASSLQGQSGTVLEPHVQYALGDGKRRVKVAWEDGTTVSVLPRSIALAESVQ